MKQLYRIIAHLDMDAFFANIEERNNPQFAEFPIVVGADPKGGNGRGVVSTANYRAREYGIYSALPISTAWKLSEKAKQTGKPPVIFLPGNYIHYSKTSEKIYTILKSFVGIVEPASIDEFYLDLSFCSDFLKATNLIEEIKKQIWASEKLTCSVGLAVNKLVAKIASSYKKPDGLMIVPFTAMESFLGKLPIGDIPGIGPRTEEFFRAKKIYTVADVRTINKNVLLVWFGRWGEDVYQKARGIDEDVVTEEEEIKSISEEETFDKDTLSPAFLLDRLTRLSQNVAMRVKRENIKGFKTITLKVRFTGFVTKTRSFTPSAYMDKESTLQIIVKRLFLPFLDRRENPQRKFIRLLGVKVDNWKREEKIASSLDTEQYTLFPFM